MPFFAILFPSIKPEIFSLGPYHVGGWELGPFAIRWYALAYIAGLILGWRWCLAIAKRPPLSAKILDIDDFLTWATVGVVLGGRLGYVLFYLPHHYAANPLEIFQVWHGGMSFHGGALGVLVAILLFTRRRGLNPLAFGDIIVCAVPIGLFFGRIANFINSELWGRVTDVPWGVIFPNGGPEPRHPSQLYEACLEGLVLFVIVNWLERSTTIREKPGALSGVLLIGYGIARIIAEFFRVPDEFLGYLAFDIVTMGQILSLPLIIAGLALLFRPAHRTTA